MTAKDETKRRRTSSGGATAHASSDPSVSGVGPVLLAGPVAAAVVAAIQRSNFGVTVLDRASYWRVAAPGRCVVTASAVEEELGGRFELPGDLEAIMCSFEGAFRVSSTEAIWERETTRGGIDP